MCFLFLICVLYLSHNNSRSVLSSAVLHLRGILICLRCHDTSLMSYSTQLKLLDAQDMSGPQLSVQQLHVLLVSLATPALCNFVSAIV